MFAHLYHGTSKHHSFFYFNWESYHQAGGSNSPTLSIPSLAERSGDFTDWVDSAGKVIPIYMPGNASAACQAAAGVGPGNQFPGNKIPAGCISPVAAAYLAALPTPTNSQPTNNYRLPKPVPDTLTSNSNVFMTRIDHNYGDKDHFYFFWWRQFTGFNTATALPVAIATESPTRPQNSPIARFNWEHTFSSTLTNHATFGYLAKAFLSVQICAQLDKDDHREHLESKWPRDLATSIGCTPDGPRRTCCVSLGHMSYEVKAGEPWKLHLTTRMVTSSWKSSPQNSAASW
jgi:hypothetical protein